MVSLLQLIIILLVFAHACSSIEQEYYLEEEQNEHESKNSTSDGSTTEQKEELQAKANTESYSYESDINQEKDEEYDDDLPLNRRIMTKMPTDNKAVTSSSTTLLEIINTHPYRALFKQSNKANSTIWNIFKAYEDYVYDQSSVSSYQRQRIDYNDVFDIENFTDTTTENAIESTPSSMPAENDRSAYDNNSIRYLADFYNLNPAIKRVDYRKGTKKSKSDYVWYVPEKYPCWDLPLVVGWRGQRESLDVFRVYYGRLTDVMSVGPPEPEIPKKYLLPETSTILNKWCNVAPCFGDHTLCIFTDKKVSKICDAGYEVTTPSMLEKISIVNTINTMRNSIATGTAQMYPHLPPAANMKQIIYDYDLEEMAKVWLRQCLPGPEPCSSLDDSYVTQLECTKCADQCCLSYYGAEKATDCIPLYECFILPVVGCLHAWFSNAGTKLSVTDIHCGHANPATFNTVQLIWASTDKIGCAYGKRFNGDIRIICNFAPGAPFFIATKYYCGLIAHRDLTKTFIISNSTDDVTDLNFLASLGVVMNKMHDVNANATSVISNFKRLSRSLRTSGLDSLNLMYEPGWAREALRDYSNGTLGMISRLVTQYTFIDEGQSRCDSDEPVYLAGESGSRCVQRGHRYSSLCYDFADPNPGYRLAAILSPIALFSLILYDLFSGVMRQTNY